MNSYVDYDYYNKTYKGDTIPQKEFEKYAMKASSKVRNKILNKDITLFETEVKNATCSVADILYNQYLTQERLKGIAVGTEKVISSEKVGDYSRNISNISIDDLKKLSSSEYVDKLIEEEIENYLLMTGLLYCGVSYVQ